MNDKLVRIWFGAVRGAADRGEQELPAGMDLSSLQKAKLRILTRQDLSDFLQLSIRRVEDLDADAANAVWERMYSELMEDAIAGVWSEEEDLQLVRFLSLCSEGVGDAASFCEYFDRALGEGGAPSREERDSLAARVKDRADRCLDAFIKERKTQLRPEGSGGEDSPPHWMDEFEYIDWVMTH